MGGIAADLPSVVDQLVQEQARKRMLGSPDAFSRSIVDLIQSPRPRESQLLSELGRTAFALQLVLSSPRQSLLQKYSLPQRVYFDASVMMPAITDGHPLSPAYNSVIKRLQGASKANGTICELAIGHQFLDEITSHRQNAVQTVNQLGLEKTDTLEKHVMLYGITNVNVFIAAYSTHKTKKPQLRFNEFLSEVAPYSTVTQLAAYLAGRGIAATNMAHCQKLPSFARIFGNLLSGYERDRSSWARTKEKILIQHEAEQLTKLYADLSDRLRTVFITADLRLQRIVQTDESLRHLVGTILSQVGFVGLVDIMVGLDADNRSMARLIWGMPRNETQQTIRDYLIRRAIDQYDAVLLMNMPQVVDEISAQAAQDAAKRKLDLFAGSHAASDAVRTARFIDEVEDRFYEQMQTEIDRLETQE